MHEHAGRGKGVLQLFRRQTRGRNHRATQAWINPPQKTSNACRWALEEGQLTAGCVVIPWEIPDLKLCKLVVRDVLDVQARRGFLPEVSHDQTTRHSVLLAFCSTTVHRFVFTET